MTESVDRFFEALTTDSMPPEVVARLRAAQSDPVVAGHMAAAGAEHAAKVAATVYVVIVDDRHVDPEPYVFTTADAANDFARQHYADNVPDDLSAEEMADADIGEHGGQDGWLYHATYSTEGDAVWVVEKTLDRP